MCWFYWCTSSFPSSSEVIWRLISCETCQLCLLPHYLLWHQCVTLLSDLLPSQVSVLIDSLTMCPIQVNVIMMKLPFGHWCGQLMFLYLHWTFGLMVRLHPVDKMVNYPDDRTSHCSLRSAATQSDNSSYSNLYSDKGNCLLDWDQCWCQPLSHSCPDYY